ncbi:MAG: alpha-amylase family glycosyl hydrolase [Acidimicrobiales bacterium]
MVDLGVDAVEIMPVAQFPGDRGWGYDGVDLFTPHDGYGGPAGLKRLVAACHRRRLGVVLDVVYNHLGPDGAHLAEFGPYLSDVHRTLWGSAVNFDGRHSDGVRRFVLLLEPTLTVVPRGTATATRVSRPTAISSGPAARGPR